MKKQIFRTHFILVFEGRFLSIFIPGMVLLMLYQSLKWFIIELDFVFAFAIIFSVGLLLLYVRLMRYFWQLFWGKMIITDESIVWKCVFYKTQMIMMSDIKLVRVCAFTERNVVRYDMYKTGFRYILIISRSGVPRKQDGRVKSGNGVISFPYSEKLRKTLYDALPSLNKGALSKQAVR